MELRRGNPILLSITSNTRLRSSGLNDWLFSHFNATRDFSTDWSMSSAHSMFPRRASRVALSLIAAWNLFDISSVMVTWNSPLVDSQAYISNTHHTLVKVVQDGVSPTLKGCIIMRTFPMLPTAFRKAVFHHSNGLVSALCCDTEKISNHIKGSESEFSCFDSLKNRFAASTVSRKR